ncbi:MAG: SDR family NAD(P)-dependent oxidoreductase, partial [Spirochaetales bacterium]|nr:SDR family NAD(P)-dependent oxidoreductase [Spirochaetales bacterium]
MALELPDELKFITNSRRTQKCSTESLRGKTWVVTGATSGIGRRAAWRLAEAGADILFLARSKDKAEELKAELVSRSGGRAEYFIADFTDLDQVKRATEDLLAGSERLDGLINSAGVHNTRRVLTPAGHETVFCVNHLATFLVTARLLPRLIESAPARIIQVNSEGHRFNGVDLEDLTWEKHLYTGLKSYGTSKTAQLFSVWEFADLLEGTG